MNLNRVLISGCLAGAVCTALSAIPLAYAAPQAASGSTTRQDATNDLSLVVGKSVLLDTAEPVQRVAVGLGEFAEAQVITPTEIMVNGKAPGETTLILWENGGNREFFNVTVRLSKATEGDRLEGVRRELRTELPGQEVKVSQENGSVFLRGTVNDLSSADRAAAVASIGGKVVNLLNVKVPASKPQILLKCSFASVDRTKSRQLGINLFNKGLGNWIGSTSTEQFSPPLILPDGTTSLSDDLNLFAFFPGLNIGATIRALAEKDLLQVLAEPNVLAEDGTQGSILAGGEYPYPIAQGSSSGVTITIMFKEYGIRLIFLPHTTPQGTIDLQVIMEVSSLDFTNAVTVSGFRVPAITERRVKTHVELGRGQSFAIGGLLDNSTTQSLQKIPFIGDVPILGKFFQSVSKTKNNSELIVVVTPEVVQPLPEGAIPNPKFTEPFMPPNSTTQMHQPEGTAGLPGAGPAVAATPLPATIPVEQLIQSMKSQTEILDNAGSYTPSGMGASGGGGGGGSGAGAGSSPQ
jgi:pilus assembly protein CpaC